MSSDELYADEIDTPGPGGGQLLVALIALFVIVLAIVGLVAIGGWVTLVIAVLMMLAGVFGVTRYVQTISLTRQSHERLNDGLSGMNEDLAVTDDAHTQISRHDIPQGEPERNAAPATSEGERS
jgi:Flp pilus assembly protein TadB